MAHDAVLAVVQDFDKETQNKIAAFAAEMPAEFRPLLVGPIETPINGYLIYVLLPDGSKEGWDTSDHGDEFRDAFYEIVDSQYVTDKSWTGDAIHVRFGGDEGYEVGPQIVRASRTRTT